MNDGQRIELEPVSWHIAVFFSVAIAAVGLLVAVATVGDVFKGTVPARTIWGVLVIVVGLLSPVLTGLLVIFKRRFDCLHQSWQTLIFIATLATPCIYLSLLLFLVHCGLRSTSTVLPLLFTPTLSIGLDEEGKLTAVLEPDSLVGGCRSWEGYTAFVGQVRNFEAHWTVSHRASWPFELLRDLTRSKSATQPVADLAGVIGSRGEYGVDIVADLSVTEATQLQIVGLYDVEIVCDGQGIVDSAGISPGRHRIEIVGRPSRAVPEPNDGLDAIASEIRALGGEVEIDTSGAWNVYLNPVELTGPGLEHVLKKLNEPERLRLSLALVDHDDRSLRYLKGMAGLRVLNYYSARHPWPGLPHVMASTGQLVSRKFWHFGTQNQEFREGGLEPLRELTGLEILTIVAPEVTDADLEHLRELTSLEKLSLWNTQMTDGGLEQLKPLTRLDTLHLCSTQLTDAGLVDLKELANLQTLCLRRTEVTDDGLEHLKGLASLRYIDLGRTHVTNKGVEKLQQALPECEIRH
jgi:hypothetical protein